MVAITDVARHANVAVGTVSRFLNTPERVAPATAERVRQAIADLGYVRNGAARQLRAGRSKTIGVLAFDVVNPYFITLLEHIEKHAAQHGLSVLLGNSGGDPVRQEQYLDLFEEQRVQGILIAPTGDADPSLERLRNRGIPAVVLDHESRTAASVSVDDVAGGYTAVAHLISRGSRRIAFVGGPVGIKQVDDRWRGAQLAVADNPGVELESIPVSHRVIEEGQKVGESLLLRPPPRRPDGVFAVNDRVALGILQTVVTEGRVSVPNDMAVIGYDDIEFASVAIVPLSSVRQPRERFAAAAVELLTAVGADDVATLPHTLLNPELVVRDSTRRR